MKCYYCSCLCRYNVWCTFYVCDKHEGMMIDYHQNNALNYHLIHYKDYLIKIDENFGKTTILLASEFPNIKHVVASFSNEDLNLTPENLTTKLKTILVFV